MKSLNILIIEDDKNICNKFLDYAENLDDIVIVNTTSSSSEGIDNVTTFLPNIVILDLELHHGSGSGIEFLSELNQLDLTVIPFILVTTNNSSNLIYEHVRQLGADFILYKHQSGYSEKYVLDFLRTMKSAIFNKSGMSGNGSIETATPAVYKKKITQRIISELNLIGINPKSVGYQYLIEAIKLYIEKPTPNISSIIGEHNNKSEASVERAMQNAINSAWKNTDIETLYKYYTAAIHSSKGVPTLIEFISYYATKIKGEM